MKSTKRTSEPNTRNNREPWRHRHFQKEKLRVTERYWHHLRESPFGSNHGDTLVLPDGRTWRRYLPLLNLLIESQQQQQQQQQSTLTSTNPNDNLQFILLESAAELMDWRSMSPCVLQQLELEQEQQKESEPQTYIYTREAMAPRERTKLLKLLELQAQARKQSYQSQNKPQKQQHDAIRAFCDLSVRDDDDGCDEWDFQGYSSMSVVDRSRHALVRAGRMLASQNHNVCKVILLVHDDEERRLLRETCGGVEDEDWMIMLDVPEFLTYIDEGTGSISMDTLEDLQHRCDEEYERRNTVVLSDDDNGTSEGLQAYLTDDQVELGLRSGELVRGALSVTKQNNKEAFVSVIGKDSHQQFFVNQRVKHFNRSLNGDIVILQRLPKKQWGRPIGRRRLIFQNNEGADGENYENDDDVPVVPSGSVVAIAVRSKRNYVATLVDVPRNDENHILLVPMDNRIPKIRIMTRMWKKFLHQRLLVTIDHWGIGSMYPQGRCKEILGPIGDLEVEIRCLLIENQITLQPFSAAAMTSLPPTGSQWVIPVEEIDKRRDLRSTRRIFSVDPSGCQDIDDTFHAEVLSNGDIEIGVHIADVTFFVPHNSALDLEAQTRGTTFYLVDRRFDMLPSLLSSDLCSLHGGADRLAVSVIWTLSADFQTVKSVWYGRTVIHNCQAMTYEQAHSIIHDKLPDEPGKKVPPLTAGYPVDLSNVRQLKKDLIVLRGLGRKLKQTREAAGAVDLQSDLGGELKFSLDKDGTPVSVKAKQDLEIHNTVAELMIYANGYVATKIYDTFPESALLRIHRSVEQTQFDGLKRVLDVGGVSLEGSSNMELANTLKKVDQAGAVVNSLIKSLATRAMSEAQYVSTGQEGLDLSHYGLGVDRYTHFTSPIRRYADVVVHKQLLASLELDQLGAGAEATKTFAKLDRPALPTIPDSNVISIMAGDGIIDAPDDDAVIDNGEFDADDFLDSLIEGASELALGVTDDNGASDGERKTAGESAYAQTNESTGIVIDIVTAEVTGQPEEMAYDEINKSTIKPYEGSEVTRITASLNQQNRMAKHSSMQCQNLFLSLYFRDHAEIAQGVVTDLRVNGFIVYIPYYDISGPVYLRDVNADVHIDPKLLGLPATAGKPPTLGFASSTACRKFPSGQCTLTESPDGSPGGASLEVTVPGSEEKFVVRTVDVVSIALRCDSWDVRSRVPPPKFLLVSKGTRPPPGFGQTSSTTKKITSKVLRAKDGTTVGKDGPTTQSENENKPSPKKAFSSMFDALQSLEIHPVLEGVPLRSRKNNNMNAANNNKNSKTNTNNNSQEHRQEVFGGRLVYHQYINPDTKSATQEAAMTLASKVAAQRRANAFQSTERRNENERSHTVEQNVMARTQRLAAGKRNDKKSKAK